MNQRDGNLGKFHLCRLSERKIHYIIFVHFDMTFLTNYSSLYSYIIQLSYRYHMFLKLFGAMGLTWILELIAWIISQYTEEVPLALTIILNTPTVLQGTVIQNR